MSAREFYNEDEQDSIRYHGKTLIHTVAKGLRYQLMTKDISERRAVELARGLGQVITKRIISQLGIDDEHFDFIPED